MQKQKRGSSRKTSSRRGRDGATVHVSHEKLFGIYFGEYSEDIFGDLLLSSMGTKKDPAGGGNARFFASRPLRQDHGSGSGALEGGVSRSFFIGAYFFNNSLRATSSAVSAPIR